MNVFFAEIRDQIEVQGKNIILVNLPADLAVQCPFHFIDCDQSNRFEGLIDDGQFVFCLETVIHEYVDGSFLCLFEIRFLGRQTNPAIVQFEPNLPMCAVISFA
jgi:hypothetical protein